MKVTRLNLICKECKLTQINGLQKQIVNSEPNFYIIQLHNWMLITGFKLQVGKPHKNDKISNSFYIKKQWPLLTDPSFRLIY